MKGIKKLYFTVILLMISTLQMMAQQKITGRVIDDDGFAVPYASVQYKGHKIAVSSNGEGKFTIDKKPGLMLTVSALSYKSTSVKVDEKTNFLEIKLKDDTHKLTEVVVKSKKGRYKRKDNPAVELMRRVIAAKKKSDLSNHDYVQYDKYQKITLALNDLKKGAARKQVLPAPTVSPRPGRNLSIQRKAHPACQHRRDCFTAYLPQRSEDRKGHHQGSAEQWNRTGNPDRRDSQHRPERGVHRCGHLR